MSECLIVKLPPELEAGAFVSVSGLGKMRVARSGEALWLEVEIEPPGDWRRLSLLPLRGVFRATGGEEAEGRALVPLGGHLPVERLPAKLRWTDLEGWMTVAPPAAALGGQMASGHARRLGWRRGEPRGDALPDMWRARLEDLADYSENASAARFSGLRFAASGDGWVLIRGRPGLPIPGSGYHENGGIAVPTGWELDLPLGSAALRKWLGLSEGEMAVLFEDGTFDRVSDDDFVRLTRGAVRLTRDLVMGRGTEESRT